MAMYVLEVKATLEQTIEEFMKTLKSGETLTEIVPVGGKLIVKTKESKNESKKLLLG